MASECAACGVVNTEAQTDSCAACGHAYDDVEILSAPRGWINKSKKGRQRWREAGDVTSAQPATDHESDNRYDWRGHGREPPRWVHADGTVVYRDNA